jgi:hypothetical protein
MLQVVTRVLQGCYKCVTVVVQVPHERVELNTCIGKAFSTCFVR